MRSYWHNYMLETLGNECNERLDLQLNHQATPLLQGSLPNQSRPQGLRDEPAQHHSQARDPGVTQQSAGRRRLVRKEGGTQWYLKIGQRVKDSDAQGQWGSG